MWSILSRFFFVGVFTLVAVQSVQAADWDESTLEDKCGAYASISVKLAQRMRSQGCLSLFSNVDPNFWTTDYQVHYNWCMVKNGVNLPLTAKATKKRMADITFCRNRAAACRDYAAQSLKHYQRAQSRGCSQLISKHPNAFNPSYQHHYNWCMQPKDRGVIINANIWRANLLMHCKNNAGASSMTPYAIKGTGARRPAQEDGSGPDRHRSQAPAPSAPSHVRVEAPPAPAPSHVRAEAPPAGQQQLHFSGTWQRSRGGEAQVWHRGNEFTWRVSGASGKAQVNGRNISLTYQAKNGPVTATGRVTKIGPGDRALHIDWSNGTSWYRSSR